MTQSPSNLLAVRSLLLTHLNIDPDTARDADLEPAEVGIVGDPDHRGGYHCGKDRVTTNDYSVVESPRDRTGLTLDAAALDVGQFKVVKNGRTHDLRSFSIWCVGECDANAPDTRDIREIIYSPDGSTVKRWDRLGKRSSGDGSHRWHTHFSFFRDAIKAGRDQRPLFHRYLTTIGILEDDMLSAEDRDLITALHLDVRKVLTGALSAYEDGRPENALIYWLRSAINREDPLLRTGAYAKFGQLPGPGLAQLGQQLAAVRSELAAISGRDVTDEEAIVEGILSGLGGRSPDEVAQTLVAAGQNPQRLAEALLELVAQQE